MNRILLIEDNAELSGATSLWLSSRGFDVTTAATGAEALTQIGGQHFDLIVTDIGLPDMTGLKLVRLIRDKCDTPAVSFTGYHTLVETEPEMNALFAAYIMKPVDPLDMEVTIRRVLKA